MTILNGTSGSDVFNIYPQIWTGGTITGYQDYTITNFQFGTDTLSVPFNGGNASFSTIQQFQQAMLDIEATGNKGWSAIGTNYSIDGADVVFSWNGEGNIRLSGAAQYLDLGPSVLVGVQGTARADHITVSYDYNAGLTNNINSGYGNDTVIGGQWDDWISNEGGNDVVYLGAGNDHYFGADDANGFDLVYGEDGNDVIWTYGGNDIIHAGGGNNTVYAGEGDDFIYFNQGFGVNTYEGSQGNDTVVGGDGREIYRVGHHSVDADSVLTIRNFDPQNGNMGGTGTDILDLWLGSYQLVVDSEADVRALSSRADMNVSAVNGDLVIQNDWFGTIVLEDGAFML